MERFPEIFSETVFSICSKFTPYKQAYNNKRKSPFKKLCYSINKKRRKLKSRIKALKNFQPNSDRISLYYTQLINLEKEAQQKILMFKKKEEEEVLEAMRKNQQFFYSYAKKKSSSKSKIGPLSVTTGASKEYTDDPKTMADSLQKQFTSVFSTPKSVTDDQEPENVPYLENITFSVPEIIKAINEIKANSSAGDDGFSASLLKEFKDELAYPLSLL